MVGDEYGRRALEFVTEVSQAKERKDVVGLVLAEMAWYGLTFVTSWSGQHSELSTVDSTDVNTRPLDYIEHYIRNDLLYKDPVIGALRKTIQTLSWSQVRNNFRLTKAERAIIEEARDFGAMEGLTIPVMSSSHCIGVFCPCGRNPDLSPRARAAIEMVCLFAQQALQRADLQAARRTARHSPLTPREREVIRWVAAGKTNDEIGSILGIQGATVKTLLGNAQMKLDAGSRTFAVVQALRLGELDLNF